MNFLYYVLFSFSDLSLEDLYPLSHGRPVQAEVANTGVIMHRDQEPDIATIIYLSPYYLGPAPGVRRAHVEHEEVLLQLGDEGPRLGRQQLRLGLAAAPQDGEQLPQRVEPLLAVHIPAQLRARTGADCK